MNVSIARLLEPNRRGGELSQETLDVGDVALEDLPTKLEADGDLSLSARLCINTSSAP